MRCGRSWSASAGQGVFRQPAQFMRRVVLELSLKSFRSIGDTEIRENCRDILRQWQALVRSCEEVAFLIWAADGSEILDYRGRAADPFEWAKWIGIANGPWEQEHAKRCLHNWRSAYMESPPVFTYERLAFVVRALKEETQRFAGKPCRVGALFDPGPEFAESSFKYERHPEISPGSTMGKGRWVNCSAILRGDNVAYAGFPDGIPDDTSFGIFLGRQSQRFLTDLGFDYLWFSNGFAFALAAWNVTGEVFDGKEFDTSRAPQVRDAILRFWRDFRRECPEFPIETRGSNLSTGMDLSAHASPVREIYGGGFNLTAPVNSPWAALNGDYGLELVGWLSHIAALPKNEIIPFRFYIHDPWWANSPWLDRYGREPHDIYLPLAINRIDAAGATTRPDSVSILTVDDSWGRRPDVVPNEVTPHLQRALADFPDAPGLVTWIYPFNEYHEWTFGSEGRVQEVFFGDWFMRAAVNQGFPLSTVVTTENFLQARQTKPALFRASILTCPVPEPGSPLAAALIEEVRNGGRVLLYGPLTHADPQLLNTLGLKPAKPLAGVLQIKSSLEPDRWAGDAAAPDQIHVREITSGGGVDAVCLDSSREGLLAQVAAGEDVRAFTVVRSVGPHSGQIGWVRGGLSEEIKESEMLPVRDDPATWFGAERIMRLVLAEYGVLLRFIKPDPTVPDPLVIAARCRNAVYFSGFSPSTNVTMQWSFPDGVPVPVGCDVWLEGGTGSMALPRAWHRECRVFVRQSTRAEVGCREKYAGTTDVDRRLIVTGLVDATVVFLPEPDSARRVRFQEEGDYLGMGREIPVESHPGDQLVAVGISGSLLISW